MIVNCKSERGYTTTGRIVGILLISLTNVSVQDYRSVNKEEWDSDGTLLASFKGRANG